MQASDPHHHVSFRRMTLKEAPKRTLVDVSGDNYVLAMPLACGEAELTFKGRRLYNGDLRPGMLRVLSPGQQVSVTLRSPMVAARIQIPAPLYERLAAEQGWAAPSDSPAPVLVRRASPQIVRLSSLLLSLPDIDPAQRELFTRGLAMAALAVARSPKWTAESERPVQAGLTDAEFAACIDFAETRIDQRLDLASWAEAVQMTAGEFARRFQQTTHMAPYAWFLEQRIDRAKTILRTTDLPLVQVALQVGFCSQSHFTEAFRRRNGVSPGRWRGSAGRE